MDNLCNLIDKNRKYYIYGISSMAKFAYDRISGEFGAEIIRGFLQTSPQIDNYCGKRVYGIEQVMEQVTNSDMFILASKNKLDEMKRILASYGITDNSMITLEKYKFINNSIAGRRINSISIWPSVEERNSDLIDKIRWFIPDRIKIYLSSLNQEIIDEFSDKGNVEFVTGRNLQEIAEKTDYIYVWDASKIDESLDKYVNKLIVIDPDFYYHKDIAIYGNTYYNSFSTSEKESFANHSREVMAKMQKELYGKKRSNVFCTGPSIEEIYDKSFEDDINIICNSMIKDRVLMEKLHPSILAFGDVAFYLSPNKYCRAFYKDLLFAFEKYHFYIIVYDYEVPLIQYHFPMLYDRLIGIKFDNSEKYHFPDSADLRVKVTRNICTLYMLPTASALCNEIGIAGCTGRSSEESYFWKHNGNTQYLDLMHYVFEAYPAFFKYSNYEDYYEKHCECIRELIEYGEQNGKKYINLTTSFIPALNEREKI